MQTVSVGIVGRFRDSNFTNFEAVFLRIKAIISRPFVPFSGPHYW